MSNLPEGWVRCTVQDVTAPIEVINPKSTPDREFVYVDIGSIDNATQTIVAPKTILGSLAPSRAKRVIRQGDTLFSTVRPYLKNIALVPPDLNECVTSTGVCVLRPEDGVERTFLFNWLRSDDFVESMSDAMDGTMYPAVKDSDVFGGEFSLPPLPEQRRIVAKIDSLFARTKRARDELSNLPHLIERYKQAILAAAFRGDLTAEWRKEVAAPTDPIRYEKLGGLVCDIRYGTAKKCSYEPTPTPVLRIPNIQGGFISHEDLKYAEFKAAEIEKLEVVPGDLLMIRSNGSVDLVGKAALVAESERGFLFAGYLIRLRPNTDEILPSYLLHALSVPSVRLAIEKSAKSTSGVNNINSGQISELSIPVRPLEEQLEIVRRIEVALGWINKIAYKHRGAAHLIDRLDQSILAMAFRGELVPQDPDDEPASVLLERIRAARAAETPKTKAPRAPREKAIMTKSRFDDDIHEKPYLADLLRQSGGAAKVEDLFKQAELPVVDFYKQLAWEVEAGHVLDADAQLKAG